MQDLKTIETSVLIDMLAQETAKFSKLFRNYSYLKGSPEYQMCKENIQRLILEVHNRNQASKDLNVVTVSKDPSP